MKIKERLLQLWKTIVCMYSRKQFDKLKQDFTQIYFEYQCYKGYYNLLMILWLIKAKPEITRVISCDDNLFIVEVLLDGKLVQLPLSDYNKQVLLKVFDCSEVSSKVKKVIPLEENIQLIRKHMLKELYKYDNKD